MGCEENTAHTNGQPAIPDTEEARPKRELIAGFGHYCIYINRNLSPGTVQFRNFKGELLGTIYNASDIEITD